MRGNAQPLTAAMADPLKSANTLVLLRLAACYAACIIKDQI